MKTIISFNSGKIKMKNSYNYYHITMKTCLSPSEMQKCNRIVFVKKIISLNYVQKFCCNGFFEVPAFIRNFRSYITMRKLFV